MPQPCVDIARPGRVEALWIVRPSGRMTGDIGPDDAGYPDSATEDDA